MKSSNSRYRGPITGLTCDRLNRDSKLTKILDYINIAKDGRTKYECVTNVLGKIGSKQKLRGYYSSVFSDLLYTGILKYERKGYKYSITYKGKYLLRKAKNEKD